jgi:hypothetical protein
MVATKRGHLISNHPLKKRRKKQKNRLLHQITMRRRNSIQKQELQRREVVRPLKKTTTKSRIKYLPKNQKKNIKNEQKIFPHRLPTLVSFRRVIELAHPFSHQLASPGAPATR